MTMYIYGSLILAIMIFSIKIISDSKEVYSLKQNLPIRGILALLVIMNHVFEEAYMLGNIAVSLFFCFSGYGVLKGYKNKNDYFKGYIWKKFKNILLPFFICNCLYIIWNIAFLKKEYTFLQIAFSFFNASIMSVAWYIIVAMILYMCFYTIYKFLKVNDNIKFYMFAFLEIILLVVLYLCGLGSWWYCSIFAFLFGMAMIEKPKYLSILYNNWINIFMIIIFIVSYMYANYFNLKDGIVFLIIKFLQSILVCAIYYNFSKKYIIKNKILDLIGKNSLFLYMIHPLIYRIITHFNILQTTNIFFYCVILLISLGISLIINFFISKISRRK